MHHHEQMEIVTVMIAGMLTHEDSMGNKTVLKTLASAALALGLIALLSSYDHITIAGRTLHLQQQWGMPLIAASVAIVFVAG